MNELEKRKTTDITPAEQADRFENYGDAATSRSIEGTLLRFSKGDYLAGKDSEEVPIGTQFVAIMDSLKVGWVCWQAGSVIDDRMGLVIENFQPPRRSELGDHDQASWERSEEGEPRDPWSFTNHLVMRAVKDGAIYTFATNSKGGLSAVGELAKVYGKTIRQRPGQYPIIELGVDSYQHRDRSLGRIKFPVFKIVGWGDENSGDVTPVEPPKSPPPEKAAAAKPKTAASQPQF
jgi:hypothetical protein